jgi:hypothetical protein
VACSLSSVPKRVLVLLAFLITSTLHLITLGHEAVFRTWHGSWQTLIKSRWCCDPTFYLHRSLMSYIFTGLPHP